MFSAFAKGNQFHEQQSGRENSELPCCLETAWMSSESMQSRFKTQRKKKHHTRITVSKTQYGQLHSMGASNVKDFGECMVQ